jgi:NAD(P)-dependent dehydrogenase (short-subunit alcohol dehydrogenase family)
LETLGRLWLVGVPIDWAGFYSHERRRRIPLPTYPFERQRYWVEPENPSFENKGQPASLSKRPDIADWFYVPSWKRSLPPWTLQPRALKDEKNCWLVFMDECGLGAVLLERLAREGRNAISVTAGETFRKLNREKYLIDPRNPDDYNRLLQEIYGSGRIVANVLHLWSVTQNEGLVSGMDYLERTQDLGLFSLISLVRAFGAQQASRPVSLEVVSNHLQNVMGEEDLSPEKATILGACKVIPLEYPNINCRSIDVALPQGGIREGATLLELLLAEFFADSSDQVVAYRGTQRWVESFEPVRLEKSANGKSRLRDKGVYLITGGLGGIGLTLAEHLAQTVRARLILVGRSAFPVREQWDKWLEVHDEQDPVSAKIRKLRSFESQGADVLVFSANVASRDEMQAVVKQARDRFGQIHGVIHCAGVADYAGVIERRSREMTEEIMAPKLQGTLVIDALFKDARLDFFVLFSSVAVILPRAAFGQVAYCAANVFLDAYAQHCGTKVTHKVSPGPLLSDAWYDDGSI